MADPSTRQQADPDLADPSRARLIVTGHPNHELAILGMVQRLRPWLLFLTDGGHRDRVAESKASLAALGLESQARFLDFSEADLYQALLEGRREPFDRLVAAVRQEILRLACRQVFVEAVEFYNPLHDTTLPIVRAAAAGLDVELVEFPLIAQMPGVREQYRVQRFGAERSAEAVTLELSDQELAVKLDARRARYPSLRRQLGSLLDAVPLAQVRREHFAAAGAATRPPAADEELRYERRGRELLRSRQVDAVITYREHYLPLATALLAEPPLR